MGTLRYTVGRATIGAVYFHRSPLPPPPLTHTHTHTHTHAHTQKLMKKFSESPQNYATLQSMVQHELDSQTHVAKNSATDALLWLKR